MSLVAQKNVAAAEEQVLLYDASISLNSLAVSQSTSAIITMNRADGNRAGKWQTDTCFELNVESPYKDFISYNPFIASNPPECESAVGTVQIECKIKPGYTDTLQFWFREMSDSEKDEQVQYVLLTNFNTPWSGQTLRAIDIRYYQDEACQIGRRQQPLPGITIQPGVIPQSAVSVTSSSDILGYTGNENTLTISFTPVTTMALRGEGTIEIETPYWFKVSTAEAFMYSEDNINRCTADCMEITQSSARTGTIRIFYTSMDSSCIKGREITIECEGFYNPIYQKQWEGFRIITYDNETTPKPIERSQPAALDATGYSPVLVFPNDMKVQPSDLHINTASQWTVFIKMPLPMELGCYVKLFYPSDVIFDFQSIQAQGFFKPERGDYLNEDNMIWNTSDSPSPSITFQGCNDFNGVGLEPYGRLLISTLTTPAAIKNSGFFQLQVFKDEELQQMIAYQDEGGYVKSGDLKSGQLAGLSITPLNFGVSETTGHRITFTSVNPISDNGKIRVKMPEALTLPMPGGEIVTIEALNDSIRAEFGAVISSNVIEIENVWGDSYYTTMTDVHTFDFYIYSSTNQPSTKDAGSFHVTTYTRIEEYDTAGNALPSRYYPVDKGDSDTSFIAEAGRLEPYDRDQGTVTALYVTGEGGSTTYATDSEWELTFTTSHGVPAEGYIKLEFPQEVVMSPASTMSGGTCTDGWTCPETDATESQIIYKVPDEILPGENITINLVGITNPRTTKPTGTFRITTYDTDKESEIDVGYDINTFMEKAGELGAFNAQQSNTVNGRMNTYTFSYQSAIPLYDGDKLSFRFPPEITPPLDGEQLNCRELFGFDEIQCSLADDVMEVQFIRLATATGTFSWTADMIRNPISFKPSDTFSDIQIVDAEGYQVAIFSSPTSAIVNTLTGDITEFALNQATIRVDEVTTYTITFAPENAIPSTGSIQLTWPQQVTIEDDLFACTIETNAVFSDDLNCRTNQRERTITITGAFRELSAPFGDTITITLEGVRNPPNNREGNGFKIMTYEYGQQIYTMDALEDFILFPQLECDYPCRECDSINGNRDFCTACWQEADDPKYLMRTTGQCQEQCTPGYTSNGREDHVCSSCDNSCLTCNDNGNVGDDKLCIECDEEFVFRLNQSQLCFEFCYPGYYQSSEDTCGRCDEPCADCEGTSTRCTACSPDHPENLSKLWNNQCIYECPAGSTLVENECVQCEPPCSTCVGTVNNCESCDGTPTTTLPNGEPGENTRFVSDGQCYPDCPLGTVLEQDQINCRDCGGDGCERCEAEDRDVCLRCEDGLYLWLGVCRPTCPDPLFPKMDDEKNACTANNWGDMGIIYFPFLIAACIWALICFFGLLKKKTKIQKGKRIKVSNQNTVTSILVGIAGLQMLATLVQMILSFGFVAWRHGVLAVTVLIIMLCLNVAFYILFRRKFERTFLPKEKQKLVDNGTLDLEEANRRFRLPADHDFNAYKKKHNCFTVFITVMTIGCSFQFNKLYYSQFYSQGSFKACWTDVKYYYKKLTWFSIMSFLLIDLLLICIAVTGLLHRENFDQLYITFIETLVLSVVGFMCGVWELHSLREMLEYSQKNKKNKGYFRVQAGLDDDMMDKEERAKMIKGLLSKVKKNQGTFLNNKLDELLHQFGDRRCKSMIELPTGWPKEEDPRKIRTVPLTPKGRALYDGEYKFTKDDAYNLHDDNVYAEAKEAKRFAETGMGADQGQREFIEALQRKTGDVFTKFDDGRDQKQKRGRGKTRGRKNPYITAIDKEDEEEAEAVALSEDEREDQREADKLAAIKEEAEAEELIALKNLEQKKRMEEEKALKKAKADQDAKNRKLREDQEYQERMAKEADEERKREQAEKAERDRHKGLEDQRAALATKEAAEKTQKEKEAGEKKRAQEEKDRKARAQYEKEEADRKKKEAEQAEKDTKAREAAEQKEREKQAAERKRLADEAANKQAADDEAKRKAHQRKLQEEEDAKKAAQQQKENELAEAERQRKAAAEAQRLAEEEAARKQREAEEEAERVRKQKELDAAHAALVAKQAAEAATAEKQRKAAEEAEAKRRKAEEEKRKKEDEAALAAASNDAERKRIAEEQERKRQADQKEADEFARKAAEEAARLKAEQDAKLKELERQQEELQRQEEEKRRKDAEEQARKAREAADKKAREDAEAARLRAEAEGKEAAALEAAKKAAKNQPAPPSEDFNFDIEPAVGDQALPPQQKTFEMPEEPLVQFQDRDPAVQVPPDYNARNFNEHDILGNFDRDDKGNVVVLQDAQGNGIDKDGQPTNERGYLRNANGDIIEDHGKQTMFNKAEVDERGEIPAPYCVERYNFNPHDLLGDLDFQEDPASSGAADKKKRGKGSPGRPGSQGPMVPHLLQTNAGYLVDKRGRRINKHGWMQQGPSKHLVDRHGRKKFDAKQLTSDGDLHKLFNYHGKRFDIKDVMGIFNKDPNGKIMPVTSKDGTQLQDNLGRRCNEKGYLVDRNGNVMDDKTGRVWWLAKHLKNGEFPKIFPYTKFNIKSIQGEYDLDPHGNPAISTDQNGNPVDRMHRAVNKRGYLVDRNGNIVDKRGKLMFDKAVLDPDGEIPPVFRTGLLKSDTASDLSRLMSEIVRNQSSDFDQDERAVNEAIEEMKRGENGSGDTSVDSMMGDTPANYNIANQRFDQGDEEEPYDPIPEEEDGQAANGTQRRYKKRRQVPEDPMSPDDGMAVRKIKKKKPKKKKKKKDDDGKYLKPTYRDFQMAGVYGGDAHFQKARPGIKYDHERVLKGDIPKDSSVPVPREFDVFGLNQLASTVSGGGFAHRQGSVNESIGDKLSASGHRAHTVKRNHEIGGTLQDTSSVKDGPKTGLRPPGSEAANSKIDKMRGKKGKKKGQVGMRDGDFEKMFGENIDQFLEDSEWDVDSFDKMSHMSRQSANSQNQEVKLKAMEKVYLSRIENQNASGAKPQGAPLQFSGSRQQNSHSVNKIPKPKQKKYVPREFQDRFVDDPDYIRRGQQWDFEIDKKGLSVDRSSGKKHNSPLRPPQGNNFIGR